MTTARIEQQVERSSLGTDHARAARRTVSTVKAAELVARAEAKRPSTEKIPRKPGGWTPTEHLHMGVSGIQQEDGQRSRAEVRLLNSQ
jgi:hypothetical protein